MPDHTFGTALATSTGLTGAQTLTIPGGTSLVAVRFTTLPPVARYEGPLALGPYYGLGHYQFRVATTAAIGSTSVSSGGPLRWQIESIFLPTKHETQIRVYAPPGGVYNVYMCG